MKIEKRKVSQNKVLSLAAKSAIAAALGMSATLALSACDDSSSARSDDNQEPLGGIVVPEEPLYPDSILPPETGSSSCQKETTPSSSTLTEEPANSSQVENAPSSSSKIVDIPLSQEALSSEAVEALSSAAESSSSIVEPTSSETDPTSSAVAPESSSDVQTPSSSSYNEWNPGWNGHYSSSVDLDEVCPDQDPWCIQVHMCENQPGCMAASMVTTFERDDITG